MLLSVIVVYVRCQRKSTIIHTYQKIRVNTNPNNIFDNVFRLHDTICNGRYLPNRLLTRRSNSRSLLLHHIPLHHLRLTIITSTLDNNIHTPFNNDHSVRSVYDSFRLFYESLRGWVFNYGLGYEAFVLECRGVCAGGYFGAGDGGGFDGFFHVLV